MRENVLSEEGKREIDSLKHFRLLTVFSLNGSKRVMLERFALTGLCNSIPTRKNGSRL